jgi:hypothetical protein
MVMLDGSFEWRGSTGRVQVECIPNDDPGGYGTAASNAFGFPVCTATVRYPRRGYNAMFGWVQMVRSTDNHSAGGRFEMDPFGLFGDMPSPYCWYGTEPTLFDAPSRVDRGPIDWVAHSFLATTPIAKYSRANRGASCPCSDSSGGSRSARTRTRRSSCVPSLRLHRVTGPFRCRCSARSIPHRSGPSPSRCEGSSAAGLIRAEAPDVALVILRHEVA